MLSGAVSILGLVLMVVTYSDGTEEAFEMASTTKLRRIHSEGFWTFTPTSGGEVSLSDEVVDQVRLGNAISAEQRQED